jgi:hypothetical protein
MTFAQPERLLSARRGHPKVVDDNQPSTDGGPECVNGLTRLMPENMPIGKTLCRKGVE